MAQSLTVVQVLPSLSSLSFTRPTSSLPISSNLNNFKKLDSNGFHGSTFNQTKRSAGFLKIQVSATLETPETPETEIKKRKTKVLPVDPAFNGRIDLSQVLRSPLLTEAAIKELANNNTLVFVVDVKANKKMIRAALKSFLDVEAKRVNTSIRADGTKKAFIQLAPEYNASDVAKRIGIFSG